MRRSRRFVSDGFRSSPSSGFWTGGGLLPTMSPFPSAGDRPPLSFAPFPRLHSGILTISKIATVAVVQLKRMCVEEPPSGGSSCHLVRLGRREPLLSAAARRSDGPIAEGPPFCSSLNVESGRTRHEEHHARGCCLTLREMRAASRKARQNGSCSSAVVRGGDGTEAMNERCHCIS